VKNVGHIVALEHVGKALRTAHSAIVAELHAGPLTESLCSRILALPGSTINSAPTTARDSAISERITQPLEKAAAPRLAPKQQYRRVVGTGNQGRAQGRDQTSPTLVRLQNQTARRIGDSGAKKSVTATDSPGGSSAISPDVIILVPITLLVDG
jgi:hypothetical protein